VLLEATRGLRVGDEHVGVEHIGPGHHTQRYLTTGASGASGLDPRRTNPDLQ
jgi:hypothetical protein